MASLSTISIQRPVLAIVMNLIILLFGFIGYKYLGVREYPSIDPPTITVKTTYPGANADVIEAEITEPLEKVINGIEGIRSISSSSNQGSSSITVEFELGESLEAAANDVRDKVAQAVRNLPRDIDGMPVVTKSDANSDAILSMTIQSDSRSHLEVSDYAENVIAQRLQTIPDVSNVQIWGQKRYSMRIWIEPAKLAAYGLTPIDVKLALDRENVELPSGKVAGDNTELTVKVLGRLTNEEEFNNLIIKIENDRPVRLKDIGYAELGPENEETMLRQSGVPMIGLGVVPQPGANYIDIADEFYKRYEQIKKDLPGDYKVEIAMDNTTFVRLSIVEVEETLMIAIGLVILIIFLFFRDWVVAIRPLIDIPVSLVGTFFVMYLFGFSINVLTLLAIVLATGLVVDDGIVVTENIFKKIEQGMSPMEAAIKGSNEIFFVIISTSVTLAAVFLPIIFLEGFVGKLFQEFGIVLATAVLISAFVSLTLTPMLNAHLLRKGNKHNRFYEATEPFFVGMVNSYSNSLKGFMTKWWLAFIILVIAVGMIFFFGRQIPSELAPLDDRSWFRIMATAPEGASYEYTDRYVMKLTDFINDSVPEKKVLLTVTAPGFTGSGAVNTAFVRLKLTDPDERQRSQQEIADYVSKITRGFPEAKTFVIQEQTISAGGGPRGALPVQFVLQAPNFQKLQEKLPLFLAEVATNPTFGGIMDVNLKFNKPELNIIPDREKANNVGVSELDIAQTLQFALSGQRFSYFTMNGKQYQVIGQMSRENRDEPLDLKSIYVRNNKGVLIQMDNLVNVEEHSSPPQLYHYNRYQSATVSAGLAPGKTIADGINAMREIETKILDESFSSALTGPSRDFEESSSNILFAFLLALVLIYLILAAQFESFIDPLIIMLTVPLAIAGAVLSLWYFNQTLNIFSQIGIIMLIGLVTKNGILIVEFANQLKEQGKSVRDAIHEAAAARLRPILMTSLATALGALPIALALGAGAKSRMSMGIVVIGGLMFSLILTLYLIPAFYYFRYLLVEFLRKYMKRFGVIAILFFVFAGNIFAQEKLTLEKAIELALKNNHSILISQGEKQIAANDATVGNAGMMPQISFNASGTYAANNTDQKFATGTEVSRKGAVSTGVATGVALNWTLFDGMRMFATYDKLKTFDAMSEINLKIAIENTVAEVMNTYYSLAKQKQLLATIESSLQLYEERVKIAEAKWKIGSGSKLDYLQAKVDMNAQKSNQLRQQNVFAEQKIALNKLLAQPVDKDFDVDETIDIIYQPAYSDLKTSVINQNNSLQYLQKNIFGNEFALREMRSQRYPRLLLNANYNFSNTQNQAGIVLSNQMLGFNGGLYLSWNIYNGSNASRQIKNAQVAVNNSQLLFDELKFSVESSVLRAFNTFMNAQQILKLEEENYTLAKENADVALESFRLGAINTLQVKEAQNSLDAASVRLVNVRYEAKVAETELMRLNGALVK